MRNDLAAAAVACDWTALRALADRNGAGVGFSFGSSRDPIAYWRGLESTTPSDRPMRALRLLLDLPFATQPLTGQQQYVWPAAHAANQPTAVQLEEIAKTGRYPLVTLQEWVNAGNSYIGYRVGITVIGDWTFLIAGD